MTTATSFTSWSTTFSITVFVCVVSEDDLRRHWNVRKWNAHRLAHLNGKVAICILSVVKSGAAQSVMCVRALVQYVNAAGPGVLWLVIVSTFMRWQKEFSYVCHSPDPPPVGYNWLKCYIKVPLLISIQLSCKSLCGVCTLNLFPPTAKEFHTASACIWWKQQQHIWLSDGCWVVCT